MANRFVSSVVVIAGSAVAFSAAHSAPPKPKQVVTGPVAEYWVSTSTQSGLVLGATPSMGSMMGAMMGKGDKVSHGLRLDLGSSRLATGEASADHMVPPALGVGTSLPLYYKVTPSKPGKVYEDEPDEPHEPPKGRILLYWGCGEKARANQPVVIDLSKMNDPKLRIAEFQKLSGTPFSLQDITPPSPGSSKTFGEWPNVKSQKSLSGKSSLVGAHLIKGNYSPDINFTLDASQDFLPAIELTGNTPLPSGAVGLNWKPVTRATGYLLSAVGGGDGENTVVMWNSSETQNGWMMIGPEYVTPSDAAKLVAQKVLLPPQATTCAVPAEVRRDAPQAMFSMVAYGGETNLSYPPRPTDPKVAWNIEWTVKVRYRSATGGILGQSMGEMMGADEPAPAGEEKPKKKKKSMLGDMIKEGIKDGIGL